MVQSPECYCYPQRWSPRTGDWQFAPGRANWDRQPIGEIAIYDGKKAFRLRVRCSIHRIELVYFFHSADQLY